MDWQKTGLIAGMAIVAWLLVIQWNQFQDNQIELSQATLVQEPTYFSDSEPSGFLENGNRGFRVAAITTANIDSTGKSRKKQGLYYSQKQCC